jgi:hypothetical protein
MPVPGIPMLTYFLPEAEIPTWNPRGPSEIPMPFFAKWRWTPGKQLDGAVESKIHFFSLVMVTL